MYMVITWLYLELQVNLQVEKPFVLQKLLYTNMSVLNNDLRLRNLNEFY